MPDNLENKEIKKESKTEQAECQLCQRLSIQVAALKDVGALRKTLLELREQEAKDLIGKLKTFEEAVEAERALRLELAKRVESAEQRAAYLTGLLESKVDALGDMQTKYDEKINGLINNCETYAELLKVSRRDLAESKDKNTELCNKLVELKKAARKTNNKQ